MTLATVRRFSKRADLYARYRPGYPSAVLSVLKKEVGLDGRDIVADVGSGTGLLSRLFLENGNRVYGVEPNGRMRSYAEKALGSFKNFTSVPGTAERTTIRAGAVDLVAVGQALHWFDNLSAKAEFSRIAKPGGHLCIVYNERGDDGLGRAYGRLIRKHETDRPRVLHTGARRRAKFFRDGEYSKFTVPNGQVLDFEGFLGRLVSNSFMPFPEEAGFVELRADAAEAFERFSSGGKVTLRYRTDIFIGRIP